MFMDESQPTRRRRIQDSLANECAVIIAIFPLLCANLGPPLSSGVYFSEACQFGGGFEYAGINKEGCLAF